MAKESGDTTKEKATEGDNASLPPQELKSHRQVTFIGTILANFASAAGNVAMAALKGTRDDGIKYTSEAAGNISGIISLSRPESKKENPDFTKKPLRVRVGIVLGGIAAATTPFFKTIFNVIKGDTAGAISSATDIVKSISTAANLSQKETEDYKPSLGKKVLRVFGGGCSIWTCGR